MRFEVFMLRMLTVLCACLACSMTRASDWPQWQGPHRDAISREIGLLHEWPADGPPLAWRVSGLGGGDSAAAVVNGVLYGMSNRDGQEIVWARSEQSGDEIWASPIGDAVNQGPPQSSEGPGGTPAVDGEHLYVIGMGGTVACLNTEDGKLVWTRSFTEDFGGILPMWSYRESPLVDGDLVICTPGSADAYLVALDKATGTTVWQTAFPSQPAAQPPAPPRGPAGPPGQSGGGGPPQIEGTKEQALFTAERWGMTGFSRKVPNGRYLANLYFAETYNGITGPGQRVFTLDVQGTVLKDFDIWEKAGGPRKAYIESVPVEVTDGEFRVGFTRQTENPVIKAIELVPQAGAAADAEPIRIKAGQTTAA